MNEILLFKAMNEWVNESCAAVMHEPDESLQMCKLRHFSFSQERRGSEARAVSSLWQNNRSSYSSYILKIHSYKICLETSDLHCHHHQVHWNLKMKLAGQASRNKATKEIFKDISVSDCWKLDDARRERLLGGAHASLMYRRFCFVSALVAG